MKKLIYIFISFALCTVFANCGYSTATTVQEEYTLTYEEQKLVDETRKIFDNQNIQISATVARVPVKGGHSESVNVEFEKQFELSDVYKLLQSTSGVCVLDKPLENVYPMPSISHGKDEVFVGRVRRDTSCINGLNLWIVADNLRKGAATNAIQILEHLVREKKKEM
mgnify:CR=1 FL=1